MKISLIDYNGAYPNNTNLALRKIKAYYSLKGHEVDFDLPDPDKVFVSVVFDNGGISNPIETYDVSWECGVDIGGPGYDVKKLLPDDIEHTCPDYEGLDFSMGRTSWGCPRKCSFCMTWRMEGIKTIEHSPFNEFVKHNKVLLYDANFLASPKHLEKLQEIKDSKLKVSFNQGLDIRLVTPEIADLLRRIKTRDGVFRDNRIYFAWDLMKSERQVIKGLELLLDHGVKPWRLMFYILTGFDTDIIEDIYRTEKLIEYGVDPFIMVYNNRRDIPEIRHLGRFVNKRLYKSDRQTVWEYIDERMGVKNNATTPPLTEVKTLFD